MTAAARECTQKYTPMFREPVAKLVVEDQRLYLAQNQPRPSTSRPSPRVVGGAPAQPVVLYQSPLSSNWAVPPAVDLVNGVADDVECALGA